jgi:hypothetical protein
MSTLKMEQNTMINTVIRSPLLYSKNSRFYITKFTPLYLLDVHRRSLKWERLTITAVKGHSGLYEVTEW